MEIKENIPLAQYTTLKIGGAAKFFVEAKDEKEIVEALKFAEEKKLPIFILGGGSNILVSDKGFDGLVVKILTTHYSLLTTSIECGAGCQLSTIVNESIKAGLTGLEWAAGIPGTIGGAVWGNAGTFNGSMSEIVESAKVLEILNTKSEALNNFKFQISNFKLKDCKFEYRNSIFKNKPKFIILAVVLKLKKGNESESERKIKEILAERKEKQPFDFPSSGSFFKNPICENKKLIEEYKKDTGKDVKDKMVPAGYIIDALGLRGKKIGGAMVSQKHGNFLVNTGNATAEDFIILISLIKQKVRVRFGIQLKEEVQLVGF